MVAGTACHGVCPSTEKFLEAVLPRARVCSVVALKEEPAAAGRCLPASTSHAPAGTSVLKNRNRGGRKLTTGRGELGTRRSWAKRRADDGDRGVGRG
jgi:hypothetical protein